ncbi:MAG: M3 family metallopeptidase, partial [Spirochaetaceae bacterium]|nr:M3 family metallopeptidase [Spirochaetaceae bacterium]
MNTTDNPLLQAWDGPYGLPPFNRIRPEHYGPAFDAAMSEHQVELAALAASKEAPSFENTIASFDRSGAALTRIYYLFSNLCSSRTDDALKSVEREYEPKLSVHETRVHLDPAVFSRIEAVYRARSELGLTPVQIRLTEKIRLDFVLAGALLDESARKRVAELSELLSAKYTAFGQAVLADEEEAYVLIPDSGRLAGLPADLIGAAAEAATAKGHPGAWAITVGRSFVEPFLTFAKDRGLRKEVWEAFSRRGEMRPERDTKGMIKEILLLRAELAHLHGYASFADYALVNRMAKVPSRVDELLSAVWSPALARAGEEEQLLTALARKSDGIDRLEPWDWLYYADQVKRRDFALDESEIKPYFSVDSMVKAMFWAAGRLFGIDFIEIKGVPLYHPDVKLFEVRNRSDGSLKGIFLSDNFARAGKRSGAWMSHYRKQSSGVVPIVVNNNNFTPGKPGEPVLISFDDATTLFHEFGHGLHGLLSDVEYQSLSGTSVLRDFVELPSQLFEHWALAPELLEKFAVHASTGQVISADLVAKIRKARTFNMGWATLQYLGPAILDMKLHTLAELGNFEASSFEREECARLGLPPVVGLRHRLPHFQHLFTGDGYSAG